MKNRFLSVIIAFCMIMSCMALPALAASAFPDVLSPDHDWAADQISAMTDLGIIKGYTDGTFKPDKAINKIEALLLFSRVAGYSNDQYAPCVDFAYDKYQYVLEDADLGAYDSYKKELSFLVYKGIMDEDELIAYVADEQYLDAFPRADAAKFLANLMDAEIKKTDASVLDFADADEIDDSVAGYIDYVVKNGFMNGVAKDDGSIVFDAEAPLSRAQVCVLLYRIIENLDMSVETGIVTSVNIEGGVVDFETPDGEENSYIIPDDAKVTIDGVESEISKILEKSEIVVVRHGKNIYSVEVINPESNITVNGTIQAVSSNKTFTKLSVKIEGSEEVATYYSDGTFKVTTDGVKDTLSSIELGDYVVVKLLGNNIVSVDRQTTEATVQGVVKEVKLTTPITLSVLTTDEVSKEENVSEYTVSDDVVIRKDSNKATLREVVAGDKVVLTITRGNISKIIATSTNGTASGTVTALKIASQSSVTISANGVETEYPVAIDASFIVGGAQASIYELRLGNYVTLTLTGTTATKVEQTSSSTATTKAGTVDAVSTAYGYLNITTDSAVSEQVFVSKSGSTVNAKILNGETGREIMLKNIKAGDYVIATGAYANGAFVAKTIVVTPIAE